MGLTHVKHSIVDDPAKRKALAERFYYSQQFMQDDPWEARANGTDAHEFSAIKQIGA